MRIRDFLILFNPELVDGRLISHFDQNSIDRIRDLMEKRCDNSRDRDLRREIVEKIEVNRFFKIFVGIEIQVKNMLNPPFQT